MGKKNPDLCERPYCREPYRWYVRGFDARRKRGWTLRVCDHHAEIYQNATPDSCVGPRATVAPRRG